MATPAAVLIYALSLLGRSADSFPPIILLDQPPSFASRNAEGFVLRDPDRIYLITSSVAFREAQRADPSDTQAMRKVASVLIHEEWHVRNGPDEAGAYEAQLRALFVLGSLPGSAAYTSVRLSMASVLGRQHAQRRQPVAVAAANTYPEPR
jgi:hypothetical protein